jgi:hypothetical protein
MFSKAIPIALTTVVGALLTLLALVCTFSSNAEAANVPLSQISVTLIGCSAESPADLTLHVFDLTTNRDLRAVMMRRSGYSRLAFASLDLQPGYYDITVGRLPCTADRRLVVLQGVRRNVVFQGQDVIHLTEGLVGLAGLLPSTDLVVTASCTWGSTSTKYTAENEDHAYYFDAMQGPALCNLNVTVRNGSKDAPFLSTKIEIDGREHSYVTKDLNWESPAGLLAPSVFAEPTAKRHA